MCGEECYIFAVLLNFYEDDESSGNGSVVLGTRS